MCSEYDLHCENDNWEVYGAFIDVKKEPDIDWEVM